VRMLGEQTQQLHAGVTGTADDADFDHRKTECSGKMKVG
jgi:hypothetical protein